MTDASYRRFLLAAIALAYGILFGIDSAAAQGVCYTDPGPTRLVTYVGSHAFDQSGTPSIFVGPNGSFTDGLAFSGKAEELNNVSCAVGTGAPLPPGPLDLAAIGPLTAPDGVTTLSTFTVSNVTGRVNALTVLGPSPASGGTITLQLADLSVAAGAAFQGGALQLNGSMSSDTRIDFADGSFGPLNATLTGGTLLAPDIAISGANVHVAQGDVLSAQRVVTASASGGASAIIVDGAIAASQFLTVGDHGASVLTVNASGVITSAQGFIGGFADGAGTVNISGGRWTLSSDLRVGDFGAGSMTVANGGRVNVGDTLFVGANAPSVGVLSITGGGIVDAQSASTLGASAASVVIGNAPGSSGTVSVSGSGSQLVSEQSLVVGYDGIGRLDVSDGGAVTISGSIFRIGRDANSTGTVNLSGSSSSLAFSGDTFTIGRFGNGTLNLSQGFEFNSGTADVSVGTELGGEGTVNLTDNNTSWTLGGNLLIGDAGTGRVTLQDGVLLRLSVGKIITLGNQASGDGTLTLAGAAFVPQQALANMVIGNQGRGTLALESGAAISLGDVELGQNAGSTGRVVVNGASTTSAATSASRLTVASLRVGGAGNGSVDVTDGAQLVVLGNPATHDGLAIGGRLAGAVGSVTVTGAGSNLDAHASDVVVGFPSLGGGASLTVSSQATAQLGHLKVDQGSAAPTARVTFDSAAIVTAQDLTIGGNANVTISGGARVTLNGGSLPDALTFLPDGSSLSELDISGQGSELTVEDTSSPARASTMGGGRLVVSQGGAFNTQGMSIEEGELMVQGFGSQFTSLPDTEVLIDGGKLALSDRGGAVIPRLVINDGVFSMVSGSSARIDSLDFDFRSGLTAEIDIDAASLEVSNELSIQSSETPAFMRLTNGATVSADHIVVLPGGAIALSDASNLNSLTYIDIGGINDDSSSSSAVDIQSGGVLRTDFLSINNNAAVTANNGKIVAITSVTVGLNPALGSTARPASLALNGSSALISDTIQVGPSGSFVMSGGATAQFDTLVETYTGGTFDVRGGRASIGAAALPATNGILRIGPGGTLRGNTILGNVVNAGGTVAPGHSPGMLTIQGDYIQDPGSTLLISLGPNDYSRLLVTGAALINGGTLQFVPVDGGTFQYGETYNVLSAAGGMSGNFSAITVAQTSGSPFITLSSSFLDGSLVVTPVHTPNSFEPLAVTPNQSAVARALDEAAPFATGDLNSLIGALSLSGVPQILATLDPLSGEAYGDFATLSLQSGRNFSSALRRATLEGAGEGERSAIFGETAARVQLAAIGTDANDPAVAIAPRGRPSLWMSIDGLFGQVTGSGGAHDVDSNAIATSAGIDFSPAPHWLAGGALGYTNMSLDAKDVGHGDVESVQAGFYGGYFGERAYLVGVIGYAHNVDRLRRFLDPAAAAVARGHGDADQTFGSAEAGYDLFSSAGARVTSFVSLDAAHLEAQHLSETGAGQLGLNIAAHDTESLRSTLGLQVDTNAVVSGVQVDTSVRLGWAHELADVDRTVDAAFIGASTVPFRVHAQTAPLDSAVVGFGLRAKSGDGLEAFARVDADLAGSARQEQLSMGGRLRW